MLVTSVWLKVQKYTTSAMCGDNKCVLAVYRAGAMYCDVRYRCVIQLYTHTIGIGNYVLSARGGNRFISIQHNRRTIILKKSHYKMIGGGEGGYGNTPQGTRGLNCHT